VWERNDEQCLKFAGRMDSVKAQGGFLYLESMHLFGCYGCLVMDPQIDKSAGEGSALDADECVHP
jgi:hypothetical protein